MASQYDIAIVGAGIVGLATAYAISRRFPALRLIVLEKEPRVAGHQTGHNSGVIHSGIYYKPGSLKARLCVEGARRMVEFCAEHKIAVQRIGKVIVATDQREIPRLDELHQRGVANGVRVQRIDTATLRQIEPHAAGIAAIHSPDTSIVDYKEVAACLSGLLTTIGVKVDLEAGVTAIGGGENGGLDISTRRDAIYARRLINCAGLHCDRVAAMMGLDAGVRIIPFRGEYYFLRPERGDLVRGLIYPVPDPALPFLGVHFTRTVQGEVEAGPNAVLAFAREGYTMGQFKLEDIGSTLTFPGFWKMAARYWQTGCYEFYRSLSTAAFVRALSKLVPDIRREDVVRGGAGVRAQAVARNGEMLADFRFIITPNSLHVLNAPSPAATASLAIGDHIAGEAATAFKL